MLNQDYIPNINLTWSQLIIINNYDYYTWLNGVYTRDVTLA